MTWSAFHAESEKLSIEAKAAAKSAATGELSLDLYRRAAVAEKQALDALEASKVRTRGITAVSAVALWFKAGEYDQAEQLAHFMLADPLLPDFARSELRHLVQAIWVEASKREAGVAFIPGEVTVSVQGGEVVTGGAPLDLIVDKVQTIQSLFYRTLEFLNGVAHRRMGRPSKELQDSCRPWLFQAAPGSYQFSVAIQKPLQPDFFKEEVHPERIAQHFLEIVDASSNDDVQKLEALVPDKIYRTTFLKLTRNLAPTGKLFDKIELRTSGNTKPITLGVATRASINVHLREKPVLATSPALMEEDLRGTLRAVHLDRDWLDVVVNGESFHVEGLEDAVDDVIGPMVNRPVIVRVIRTSPKKFKYIDIELAE